MRSIQKLITQLRKSETGFTLVELLVVVGIIVALAAVIIPNVARFTSKGAEGAYEAEAQNVQTAFDTLMADVGIGALDPTAALSLVVSDFSALPLVGGLAPQVNSLPVALTDYLRGNPTNNYYCWDGAGLISSDPLWTVTTTC